MGDVPEDKHDAHGLPVSVPYRRAAVVDGDFSPVLLHQDSMIGKTDNRPFPEHLCNRAFNLPAGVLVDDIEYLRYGPPGGFRERPAGQVLRNRIHERDAAFDIGGDNRIAYARERGGETLLALAKVRLPVGQSLSHAVKCAGQVSKFAAFHHIRHVHRVCACPQFFRCLPEDQNGVHDHTSSDKPGQKQPDEKQRRECREIAEHCGIRP